MKTEQYEVVGLAGVVAIFAYLWWRDRNNTQVIQSGNTPLPIAQPQDFQPDHYTPASFLQPKLPNVGKGGDVKIASPSLDGGTTPSCGCTGNSQSTVYYGSPAVQQQIIGNSMPSITVLQQAGILPPPVHDLSLPPMSTPAGPTKKGYVPFDVPATNRSAWNTGYTGGGTDGGNGVYTPPPNNAVQSYGYG